MSWVSNICWLRDCEECHDERCAHYCHLSATPSPNESNNLSIIMAVKSAAAKEGQSS
jgi:hypothetical protein